MIVVVNAIIAGFMAAAGSVMAATVENGSSLPSKGAWIVAACVFIISAGKDWQSHITLPPAKALTAALAALCLLLSGCMTPALLREMAKDSATFCGRVSSLYGTVEYARTNISAGNVECNGLKVTSK